MHRAFSVLASKESGLFAFAHIVPWRPEARYLNEVYTQNHVHTFFYPQTGIYKGTMCCENVWFSCILQTMCKHVFIAMQPWYEVETEKKATSFIIKQNRQFHGVLLSMVVIFCCILFVIVRFHNKLSFAVVPSVWLCLPTDHLHADCIQYRLCIHPLQIKQELLVTSAVVPMRYVSRCKF